MFPGQNYAPQRLQGPHTNNKMLRPPGNLDTDLLDGSSRKRKSISMDQPATRSESTFEYSVPWGSNLQKATLLSGAQVENQAYGLCLNQPNTFEPKTFLHQLGKDQSHYQNSYSGSRLTGNGNFLPNGTQNLSYGPPHSPCHSTDYRGSLQLFNMRAGEDGVGSTWQSLASNVLGPRKSSQSLNDEGGVNDVPTVGADCLGHSLYTEENHKQNEVQFGRARSLGILFGEFSDSRGQGNGDGLVRAMEKTEASDLKNLNNPMSGFSPKSCSPLKTIENSQKNDSTRDSLNSDEKNKSGTGNMTSVVAEKLWEGSLQLSSSVTVSSVAYFKSGEKLLDTNWSESVEVKGKVRLEAFEKYIQDLPRSRNKGLMVISLCWKEGSPEAGLKGMKEVAKGYKKGGRVGFAHLSPGIDLYICPRSEVIITILAKYGFFKGMAAIEDKQDSMIGCVVWRRNRTSSDSIAKKTESKSKPLSDQQLKPPSESPNQEAANRHSPLTQVSQESLAHLSVTDTSSIRGDGQNGGESKNNSSTKTQIEVGNSLSGGDSLLGAQRTEGSNSSSHKVAEGDLTMVENQPTNWLGPEQHEENLKPQNPVMPSPTKMRKETKPSDDDDDDLPEYDFMAACGISLTNMRKPLESGTFGKGLSPDVIHKTDRPVHIGVPNAQAKPLEIPVFPHVEERDVVRNQMTTSSVSKTVCAARKNLFDDDDMPEWCPPEHGIRPWTETTRPNKMPSESQNSDFQNFPRGPPFSSQAFPSTGNFSTSQPRPLQRGSSSLIGSNFNPILGLPPSFHAKIPSHPADKRRWRPH